MSTHTTTLDLNRRESRTLPHDQDLARYLVPAARALFAFIFLISAPGHFSAQSIAYATQAGVPFAAVLVPVSGVIALLGGLSILLGYQAKIGAWLLVAFLVPVTLTMHRFWGITDPMQAMMQRVMFFKNLTALGGALLIAYFGAGPLSFDELKKQPS